MNTFITSAIGVLALSLLSLAAQAQTATAHVEKAKIVGGNNIIALYGLPALDSTTGKYKYWDTIITLEIDSVGKPTGMSSTVSVKQAKANSTEFVPGVYVNGYTSCNLLNSAFSGRTELDLHCVYNNSTYNMADFTWFTGPINGHPWEGDLVAAGLNTLVGNDQYSWGKTMYTYGTWFGCFNPTELLSARQVGNTLTLVNYGADKVIDCSVTLTRQP